jgi:hypothetical protein
MKRTKATGLLLLVAALSACSGMRSRPPASVPSSPSPATIASPPPPAEPAPPPSVDNAQQPTASNSAVPNCVAPEPKSKPKPKAKPKQARQETPPQLPTAPVVSNAGPDGTVDAQVKAMPVSVMSILGKQVKGAKGEDLGRVVDVLADASGRVRIAIIDFGGFLGVGDHRIAVDWPLLRFNPDGRDPSLLLSVSREKLQGAPEYKQNPRPQTLMEPPTADAAAAPADKK